MKIIHCADIHLGSKMDSRLPKEKAEIRKNEVRATFNRLIEYAKSEKIGVILLAGDVFDSDRPLKKDKEFFYAAVKANPQIDFLYLRGNHDGEESYTESDLKNLKTFSDKWTSYTYGNVVITGLELCAENCTSMYSTLNLDKDKLNIVTLHGQTSSGTGKDKINLLKLREKNIDYLALGHIHDYRADKLDSRGTWCYSGCLEGRGFDETGKKGFVLLDIDEKITAKFIPFARREIAELTVDLTGTANPYEAKERVQEYKWKKDDLLRLILSGEINYSGEGLAEDMQFYLQNTCYFLSVKDKTVRKFDISEYEGDLSLKGEFVRGVLSSDLDDDKKQRIIYAGLKALSGRGEDL